MVKAQLPIRIMPVDLAPGNHVLLLVSATASNGAAVDIVYMQDVRVLQVGQGSAQLWIPTKLFPQVVWYADHGGIFLATIPPGHIQQRIPAGGAAGSQPSAASHPPPQVLHSLTAVP